MSSISRGTPPAGTAAKAGAVHRVMMAVEPPTMVPIRNSRAKTSDMGMGSLDRVAGSSAMTPLSVRTSLNTMTTRVLMTMRDSMADRKKGVISLNLKCPMK